MRNTCSSKYSLNCVILRSLLWIQLFQHYELSNLQSSGICGAFVNRCAKPSITNGRGTSNKFVSPDDRSNVSQRVLIRIESIRYGLLFSELLLFPQGNSCFIRRTPPRFPLLPSSVISWGGAGAAPPPSQANPQLMIRFRERKYHWIWQFKPTKSP